MADRVTGDEARQPYGFTLTGTAAPKLFRILQRVGKTDGHRFDAVTCERFTASGESRPPTRRSKFRRLPTSIRLQRTTDGAARAVRGFSRQGHNSRKKFAAPSPEDREIRAS